jgi:HemY protein
MKQLLLIFCLIFISVLASTHLIQDAGYVLILFNGWQIQSSLVVALVFITIFLICFHVGFDLLAGIIKLPCNIKKLFKKLIELRQTKHLRQGLEAYYQGDWLSALKKFSHAPTSTPWVVDLIAAQAAQHQGDLEKRDKFLHLASLNEPKARETILLFQANLQYEQGQYEQSQSTLKYLATISKDLPVEWFWLQSRLYLHFKSYESGLNLLKEYQHLKAHTKTYNRYYKKFILPIIHNNLAAGQFEKVYEELKALPKNLKDDIDILSCCAPSMIKQKKYGNFINRWIQKTIKKEKNTNTILRLIEKLPPDSQWLKVFNDIASRVHQDAEFYLLLGKIKTKHQLWGSAIADLQQSLDLKKSSEAYACLAKIYLALQQTSNALEAMQHALDLEKTEY